MTARNDLAGSGIVDTFVNEQILAGEKEIVTGNGVLTGATVAKYQLLAKAADGTVHTFVPGTDTIPQAVIAAQPAVAGQSVPYFESIYFNYAMLVFGAAGDGSLNTYLKAKGAFNGSSEIKIGHIAAGA